MRSSLLAITVAMILCGSLSAQEVPDRSWTIGTELDAFPYATGGWYASIFGGYETIRLRAVAANSFLPAFVRPEGINEQRVNAYAGIIDFMFKRGFDGWWLGFGYEYWDTRYTSSDGVTDRQSHVLTVGGGYIWRFWKGFYLNPWAAAHVVLNAEERITVGSTSFVPAGVLPEISLKLGLDVVGSPCHQAPSNHIKEGRMELHSTNPSRLLLTLRWSARVISILVLVFWGIFIIAHLFGDAEDGGNPLTTRDFVLFVLMGGWLLGLALGWKWELLGGSITVACFLAAIAVGSGFLSPPFMVLVLGWRPLYPGRVAGSERAEVKRAIARKQHQRVKVSLTR